MRLFPLLLFCLSVSTLLTACPAAGDDEAEGGLTLNETAVTPTSTAPPTPETIAATPTPTPTQAPTATPAPVPEFPEVLLVSTAGVPAFVADAGLEQAINDYTGGDPSISVVVKNLADGRGAAINAGQDYYAASMFKVFVMYEVFHQREIGNLAFDEQLEVTQEWIDLSLGDSVYTTPGRDRQHRRRPRSHDRSFRQRHRQHAGRPRRLGEHARLGRRPRAEQHRARRRPADLGRRPRPLSRGHLRRAGLGPDVDNEMLNLLARQRLRDRIPKYLPDGTRVANKTGSWSDVTHDAGIVFGPNGAYVIAVMVGRGGEHETIAEISRIVYAYLNP